MSFQERRTLVSLISTVLITALYSATMAQRYPTGSAYAPDVFRFWGAFFLILIPVSIVARIVIHIVFSILNTIATRENEPSVTDERDRLIELRANQTSTITFSLGFVVAMVALVADQPPSVMFAILLCAGVAAELIGDASRLYSYRRGF